MLDEVDALLDGLPDLEHLSAEQRAGSMTAAAQHTQPSGQVDRDPDLAGPTPRRRVPFDGVGRAPRAWFVADTEAMTGARELTDAWSTRRRVVVLSGAGMSTDSGIPDFRGPNGLWTRNPRAAAMFDIETHVQDEEVRRQAWEGRRRHPAWTAEPNPGHLALTHLQQAGRLGAILTQNIDGLHQRAGSVDVVELHGTVWEVECLTCAHRTPTHETLAREEPDPRCLRCGGILKTATISFGQRLDPDVLDAGIEAARSADLLVAIGTTLTVMPAAGLAEMARHLAIVNAEPTPYDDQADVVVRAPIGEVLPEVAEALLGPG